MGVDAPLGDRPAEDDLELTVAEARIASRLFGVSSEVLVGRYRLLEMVGRGGMSVVWGAWDPELERKVAIKLVDALKPTSRDRIVDEARALAKLSHPNVVPIYDVGVIDDRVYLVMEWIVGENLRTHLAKPRTTRAILELYVQAARGLAAVHAASLVHRDFKPENAVVGADGRVRVLDFGLARTDVDDTTTDVAGTPRYIAPEHLAGGTPTAAVDQYALCIALGEALPAPKPWIAAIVARGTAEKPGDRFASMDELIRALERDPARVWRTRILVGAALAATATAFVVGRSGSRSEREVCTAVAPAIDAATRARIAAHVDGLGAFAAGERAPLLARLDEHQRRLDGERERACLAHDRGALTTAFYERRVTCLARVASSLATTAEILGSSTARTFPDARVAASSLVDPASCTNVDQSLVPLPDELAIGQVRAIEIAIERARMLATATRPDAIAAATAARLAAEATGYPPLLAHALLAEGRARMFVFDDRAGATLDRAMRTAIAARDDAAAVEAFARYAYVVAFTAQNKVVDGANVIEAIADRLDPEDSFARQLLRNNLATVVMSTSNDLAPARLLLEEAMRSWRAIRGENEYELVSIPQNLALVAADPARSRELLAFARGEYVRLLGENHPHVLRISMTEALFVDLGRARELFADTCPRYARLFPDDPEGVDCTYEAAWLADEAGDDAAARALFASSYLDSADIRGPVARLLAATSPTADAIRAVEQAAARDASAAEPFTRALAADGYMAVARAWDKLGEPTAARRAWLLARPILEKDAHVATHRRLARVRRETN
ncbi:MAG: protein kinase domain-containing protein [Kofleriaceae bacterium]